jgi:uncharacterized protein (DUF2236 family)
MRSHHPTAASPPATPGRLFGPERTIWSVDREAALLLGAGRALLLQVAHPLVAAGVAAWSRFDRDPLGRLVRTLDPVYTVVFGDLEAARAAVSGIEAAHRRVRGALREPVGCFPRGTPYDAGDPALQLWVHATLVDTSLVAYRRFVRPLGPAEEAAYYADSRELGRFLGVPDALLPPTIEEFQRYVAGMLASDRITVGPAARAIARMVFWPPRAPILWPVGPVARFVTAGLLPPRVREGYGYGWSGGRERLLRALAATVRATLPILPSLLRHARHARRAERAHRRAAAPGARP